MATRIIYKAVIYWLPPTFVTFLLLSLAMPPRKAAAAKSKAAVTPPAARGRGRPPKPKAVKSREFIDDEADDLYVLYFSVLALV
jgi:hypothetical protein